MTGSSSVRSASASFTRVFGPAAARTVAGIVQDPQTLLTIDAETAEFYAEILIRLKIQGTPIPTNDIWIAAAAFQHGLKLFTRDRHFRNVTGLILI